MPLRAKAISRRHPAEKAIRAAVMVALALLALGSFTGIVPRHDADPDNVVERR